MPRDTTIEKAIGKRIQKLRREKGYTQQQFAEKINLSTNYLSDLERGKSSPRLDKLVVIINALDCTADDLFADVLKNRNRIWASRLSEQIEALPDDRQGKILAVLDALLTQFSS